MKLSSSKWHKIEYILYSNAELFDHAGIVVRQFPALYKGSDIKQTIHYNVNIARIELELLLRGNVEKFKDRFKCNSIFIRFINPGYYHDIGKDKIAQIRTVIKFKNKDDAILFKLLAPANTLAGKLK